MEFIMRILYLSEEYRKIPRMIYLVFQYNGWVISFCSLFIHLGLTFYFCSWKACLVLQ